MRRYIKDYEKETKYLNEHATFREMLYFFYHDVNGMSMNKENKAADAVDEFIDSTTPEYEDDYDEEDGVLYWAPAGYLYDISKDPDDYISNGIAMIPLEIEVEDQTEDYEGDVYGEVPSGHGAWVEVPVDMDSGWTWREVLETFLDWDEDDDTLDEVNDCTMYTFVEGRRPVGDAVKKTPVSMEEKYVLELNPNADDDEFESWASVYGPNGDCVLSYSSVSMTFHLGQIVEALVDVLKDAGYAVRRRNGVYRLTLAGEERDVKKFVDKLIYEGKYDAESRLYEASDEHNAKNERDVLRERGRREELRKKYPKEVSRLSRPDFAKTFGVKVEGVDF